MSNEIIEDIELFVQNLKAKFKPEVKVIENDVKAIGAATLAYIESNGLAALYAIAKSALLGAETGTPWAAVAATVVTQGEAAGISIAKGAETIVLAQAQADLISVGQLIAPTTGTVVATAAA